MKPILLMLASLALTGCAWLDVDRQIAGVDQNYRDFTAGDLQLSRSPKSDPRELLTALEQPLDQTAAVRIALLHSPAFQVLLNEHWQRAAEAAQEGRIPNPVFAFERMREGDEVELGRMLSIGLLDLLTVPQRRRVAAQRLVAEEWRLASEVVGQITEVRQVWVRAVAAEQLARYAEQVRESAEASAELARRMESVGNFNRITRARQQAFYADATTQLAVARQEAVARREELVRKLGLDDEAAAKLRLPATLPVLPANALSAEAIGARAATARIDVQWARYELEAARAAQGLKAVTSWTDVEAVGIRNTMFDEEAGTRETARGFELEIRLPLFDPGDLERAAMNARTLAAFNRYESTRRAAGSYLREQYLAYRTAYDLAVHHRDEIVPLRKTISEENLLRYNGMLIGVFELLADSREQIAAVMSSIAAQQQFWLADAALQASVVGKPQGGAIAAPAGVASAAKGEGH